MPGSSVPRIRMALQQRVTPGVRAGTDDNIIGDYEEYEGYDVDELDQLYRDLKEDNVVLSSDMVLSYVDGNVDEWNYWVATGEREEMFYVFRVLGEDRHYKATGYFSSEEGRVWETLHEVNGEQRIVTDWVRS